MFGCACIGKTMLYWAKWFMDSASRAPLTAQIFARLLWFSGLILQRSIVAAKGNMSTLVNATAFVITFALCIGHAGAESAKTSLLKPYWSLARDTDQKAAQAKYAAAMARYREHLVDIENPGGLAGPLSPAAGERWTWLAADGSIIRRLDDRTFSLISGDCVRILCLETNCIGAGWPLFVCEDGRQRTMSAPNFSTVIFDGITFRRIPPPPALYDDGRAPE
jgi:hypothetical protein